MNLRLLLRLFFSQLLVFLGLMFLGLGLAVHYVDSITWDLIFSVEVFSIPLIALVVAFVIVVCVIYSWLLTSELNEPYEMARAQVNWLLLGRYNHPIFEQKSSANYWYDSYDQLSLDLGELRDKIIRLNNDLQELSAAPVFVGEDTREEIIEEERQRIARELHDSVSQQLFAATMMISTVNEMLEGDDQINPAVKKQLDTIEDVIANAQAEMRALLLHLRPIELEDKSLKAGIENLLKELDTKIPMKIKYNLEETRLESGIEDHLFRIVQEALSNTLRHAKADNFEVYLSQDDNSVRLRIIDDGVGFDTSEKSSGYGLDNIEERVSNMGGSFNMVSALNQGTIITITVPVYKKG